ncbi:putative knottin, scorpion toxin, defensin, plant, knottin, scorpion toxin-like superfamily [Helianthus debilis subsp. tardiflorus]
MTTHLYLSIINPDLHSKPSITNHISMEKISIFLILLLLILVPFKEAEGRNCESQSHKFEGRCMSNHNCGLVCRNEGFTGGVCRGARGRCFCTKTC